jgi:hypothetical protein
MGTKRIPIARPQLLVWESGKKMAAAIIFRDSERDNKVSVAVTRIWVMINGVFTICDDWLDYGTILCQVVESKRLLNLFIQNENRRMLKVS